MQRETRQGESPLERIRSHIDYHNLHFVLHVRFEHKPQHNLYVIRDVETQTDLVECLSPEEAILWITQYVMDKEVR